MAQGRLWRRSLALLSFNEADASLARQRWGERRSRGVPKLSWPSVQDQVVLLHSPAMVLLLWAALLLQLHRQLLGAWPKLDVALLS